MTHLTDETIALWVGGDLESTLAMEIGQHCAGCQECQAVAKEFEFGREWLARNAEDPAEADIRSLRKRVLPGSKRWMAWTAAALVLIGLGLAVRQRPLRQPSATGEMPVASRIQTSEPKRIIAQQEDLPRHKPRRLRRAVLPAESATRSISVLENAGRPILKITTPDPSVVIYWTPSGETDQERKND